MGRRHLQSETRPNALGYIQGGIEQHEHWWELVWADIAGRTRAIRASTPPEPRPEGLKARNEEF